MRAVKMLKAKVSAQQEELRTQAETIKVLHDHKQRGGEHLQQLQHQLQEQAEQHSKKDSLQKQVLDYERSLAQSHNLLVESRRRESTAMRKIQEAISISEEATRERDEAKTRCESYKEELTQLASNIGSIMDEAASRTDNEVAKLRSKLGEKDKLIADIKEKFKRDSEKHKSVVHHLETRNNQLEQKWKEANKQIDRLEAELEATTRRLMDVEKSFNGGEENRDCKAKKHHDLEVERYFMTQKQIKKYHQDAMDDITRKFEAEIYRLSKHNSELQAANHLLRSGAAGDCIGLRV
ncbi:hypothetical protein KR018_008011 [Drosophila ironensis]|nr:hypothetical protein KR018_008011 [Drosophila ironensis]